MTIIIIIITSLVSILAFSQQDVMGRLQFNAYQVVHRKEYFRIFTHAFLHANWEHLLINMIVLWSFGTAVEHYYYLNFGSRGTYLYFLLYFGAILFSSLGALIKQKNNYYYNAVGASGAVSAVVFSAIFFAPWNKIYFFGLLPIPGVVFAVLYLVYSYQMSKRNVDNVGHDAHFLGAIFGFILPIIIRPSLFLEFINNLF
ncbi:rhomboid family intramembrane serine protease [Prolixibacter sp. SD074]|uniref:rhomboid family intramembrane serine protease n=1 Tax=Prolixibacter sp. SD074 TaxID=2652391 RepID=UPI00127A7027|nr:rhomboid family intramembrane serine protease [Prolixibacter sp. SD074]GET30940.1 rhomboid family intramembrane serine protease [Prolixibacter sp. SD074]